MMNLPRSLSNTTLAYAAGIIDGEGCIFGNKSTFKRVSHLGPYYNVRVAVSMTDYIAIEFLHHNFGGTITAKGRRRGTKQVWVWELADSRIASTLKLLLPYLLVKRQQAKVAIKFRNTVGPRGTGYRRTKAIIAKQAAFCGELKRLKKVSVA